MNPPKPTALKVLRGNPGKRRIDPEPIPPEGEVVMPSWLQAGAADVWASEAPKAIEMGVLTTADVETFAMYCAALGEYRNLYADIETNGTSYRAETMNGFIIRPRPEVQQASDAWKRAKAMATEFGLTASSRARIKNPASAANEDDPFARFERAR